jgi:NarL family two-component system response regulator YdfI
MEPVNEGLTALLSGREGIPIFRCAQEPAKVLALVKTVHPDVVILDLQMEGPIGLRTLRQIKSLPHAPVVIGISHSDTPLLRQAGIAAGADCFLSKATECERLLEELHDLLFIKTRSSRDLGPLKRDRQEAREEFHALRYGVAGLPGVPGRRVAARL